MMDMDIETLAAAAHQIWVEGKLRDGWAYSAITDKDRKLHSSLVPYAQLSEADKQSDRDFVNGIPQILARAGYRIVANATERPEPVNKTL